MKLPTPKPSKKAGPERTAPRLPMLPTWVPPTWDELLPWVIKTAKRHHWRASTLYCLDDVIQEAALKYVACLDSYGKYVEPRHFGALFRTAVNRRIHDLSNDVWKHPTVCQSTLGVTFDDIFGSASGLPEELQEVLRADPELMDFAQAVESTSECFQSIVFDNGMIETTIERIARIADVTEEVAKRLRSKIMIIAEILLTPSAV